jgi:CBS domain containing-hemolysin-like protein
MTLLKFSIKHSMRWSIFISIITFALACLFTVTSTAILEGFSWAIGIVIVLLLVCTGIFFDILGLAAAAANEKPFHAMASERVRGAKQAIYIVRHADRFSNICNDVIGDMTSIISGSASAIVILKVLLPFQDIEFMRTAVSVVFTALVSALTVGGKALGKSFALHYTTNIVLMIGKSFYLLERRFGIRIFTMKRLKAQTGKRGNKRAAREHQSARGFEAPFDS